MGNEHDILDYLERIKNNAGIVKSGLFEFYPVNGFIYLEPIPLKELKTTGGIIVPDNINSKATVFRVIATGEGEFCPGTGMRFAMSVKVGDLVLVDVAQLRNLTYSGQDVHIVEESAIYGKVQFKVSKSTNGH